jgi:hypothetical protein
MPRKAAKEVAAAGRTGKKQNEVAAGLSPATRLACVIPRPRDPGNPAQGGRAVDFLFPPFAWPGGLCGLTAPLQVHYNEGCAVFSHLLSDRPISCQKFVNRRFGSLLVSCRYFCGFHQSVHFGMVFS